MAAIVGISSGGVLQVFCRTYCAQFGLNQLLFQWRDVLEVFWRWSTERLVVVDSRLGTLVSDRNSAVRCQARPDSTVDASET